MNDIQYLPIGVAPYWVVQNEQNESGRRLCGRLRVVCLAKGFRGVTEVLWI